MKHLVTLFLILGLVAGCLSSTGKHPDSAEKKVASQNPVQGNETLVSANGNVECSVVTQYGGRTESCSNVILPEDYEEQKSVDTLKEISGSWRITSGYLNIFPDYHFIGEGMLNPDGSYELTIHPREFDPSEGEIVFQGTLSYNRPVIAGRGESKIYSKGEAFSSNAKDVITAQIDETGNMIEGSILSVSSFHETGGFGNATFNFVMER